jgi:hypothetical protein
MFPAWTAPRAAPAADGGKQQQADRRAVQAQLHSRSTLDRVEAVRRLADFPALEGAKLALSVGLADRERDVRQAAFTILLAWNDEPEVAAFLLKNLENASRGKGGSALVLPLVGVLAAAEQPEVRRRFDRFLEAYVTKSKDGATAMVALADDLGELADEQALRSLKALTRQKCVMKTFACRRAVVQAMLRVRRPEAVSALLALLPNLDGEVRGDVVRYLEQLSGQQHGYDAGAWQAWWKEHQPGFEFPRGGGLLGAETAPKGVGYYYGLPLYARRMVFVIDVSGSMAGPRLAAAQRELTTAINGLPAEAEFGLVAFHSAVFVWRREMVRATAEAKQEARLFVYQLAAHGRTATYDALDAAFRFDPEAVYLLSDGEPNAGRVPAPAAIVAAIGQANRARRISIYSIGIAPGAPGSDMELFMKTLAEQNLGRYRRLDQ